jgi:ribose 5-phosphate isomerase B
VQSGEVERGVIICGSGVGAAIAANKFPGVRAGLTHDTYSAGQGVRHDDMNVMCLGARVVGVALAEDLVKSFMAANLEADEPRFLRRLEKVAAIENDQIPKN